jgi:enoyl-CoA hydratase
VGQPLSYDLREGVAVIAMDDGKANALSHEMLGALSEALDRAEREAKAVLLAGRAGRFCAGFDLRVMMSGVEAATALVSKGAGIYLRLYDLPLPLVAACTGHALAGGALLLLVSDTRIGAEGAFQIGLNEVAISMPLPILAQELARDRLSKRALVEATLQARIYTPAEAVEVGYLDAVTGAEGLLAEAHATAKRLGALPQAAHAKTKASLRARTIHYIRETLGSDLARLTS